MRIFVLLLVSANNERKQAKELQTVPNSSLLQLINREAELNEETKVFRFLNQNAVDWWMAAGFLMFSCYELWIIASGN